jgi:hypothetical protein
MDCETSRLIHFLDSRLTDGCEVVSLTNPLSPGRFLVLISVRNSVESRATVGLEGIGQLRNPMTLSEIQPSTFNLGVCCLKELCYRVPQYIYSLRQKFRTERNSD